MKALGKGQRLCVALIATLLVGCASSKRFTSDVDDYTQFREVRLAQGVEQRLKTGWNYLKTQPRGEFRAEVEPWYNELEERFLKNAWDHPERLRLYLDVLPDGPRVAQVQVRLEQLQSLEAQSRSEEAAFLAQEAEREERLGAAKVARGQFVRALTGWVRHLAEADEFSKPVAAWSPAFKQRFFEEKPMGLCEGSICTKTVPFQFDVPEGRGVETRTAGFTINLYLSEGKLAAADVEASEMFSRLGEAAAVESVGQDDLQARAEAIGTSTQIISLALEVALPKQECQQQAVSPTIVLRRCRGKQAEAVIGEDVERTDRVRILPSIAHQPKSETEPAHERP